MNELENRALWLLAHADQAEPREPLRGMALQLRLWRYSPSGLHVSWSIILPVREYGERQPIVREAVWHRSDHGSVRIRDAEIASDKLAPFLTTAGGLSPERSGAVAAPRASSKVRAGLEGSRSFGHVRLEWSGRGPSQWATTIAWFERFRKLLVRSLR